MMNGFNRVLILAPHTDDGELGVGGTISKLIKEGKEVFYVAFSCPKATLKREVVEAMKILELPEKNLILMDYHTRYFPQQRQSILEQMILLNRDIKPDLVFLPSSYDTHQDHQVISKEGLRAFKKCSILGYEQPWNNFTFKTDVFSVLDEGDIRKKIQALGCYSSQLELKRPYFSNDFIKGLATVRGVQISERYAEVFECIRWIL